MNADQWIAEKIGHEIVKNDFSGLKNKFKKYIRTPSAKVITIGGTNGKGQTARCLSTILSSEGYQTALFTSPHLLSICERFSFNDVNISDEEMIESFESMYSKLGEESKDLSFFEFLFFCFCDLCNAKKLDFIILEVGLGGRLDATNLICADYAVLTSISRDHQKFLGNKYSSILNEKLGITRKGKNLFTAFDLAYLNQLTSKYVNEHNLNWSKFNSKLGFSEKNSKYAQFIAEDILGKKLAECSTQFYRLKFTSNRESFYLIPAHNPDGVRKMFQILDINLYNKLLISFSDRPKSDLDTMVMAIKYFWKKNITFCNYSGPKGYMYMKKLSEEHGVDFVESYNEFIKNCNNEEVIVFGSNYFIADFYNFTQRNL